MKLMVMTAAVFPSEEDARRKMWIFLRSAERAGVPPEDLHLYGIGRTFPGYRQMCLDFQLEYLKSEATKGYSHCLFHDGWDGMFCAPLSEIVSKYERMGSPRIVCSAYIGLGNQSDMSGYEGCFDETIPYRYPNRGGWLGEIPAMIEAYERMLTLPDLGGDDCFLWYRSWREGWFRPTLDHNCEIFQVSDVNLEVKDGRARNTVTGSRPCILHFSGGFTHSDFGKDPILLPWARALTILE